MPLLLTTEAREAGTSAAGLCTIPPPPAPTPLISPISPT